MASLVSRCVLEERAVSRRPPFSSRFTDLSKMTSNRARPPLQTGGEDEGGESAACQPVARHAAFVLMSAARVKVKRGRGVQRRQREAWIKARMNMSRLHRSNQT